MNEKVLVTGGAGYVGSVLTGHFLNRSYDVTCLDNLLYQQDSLKDYRQNPNFKFICGDVRDKRLLEKIIPAFDIIIPLAAIVGMPACNKNPDDAVSVNRDAVIMLNNLRSKNQKLIFPTTNSGYGTRTGEVYCTEETPLEPVSLYGKVKCEAEKALLNSEKGAITLRLATVFGMSPRMRTDLLVNDFVLEALCKKKLEIFEGYFKRNYVHIKDIARCFEHCVEYYNLISGECYNVGLDNANLSKSELAERIKKQAPELEIEEGKGQDVDKRNYIVSNEKIRKTGFECAFNLDYGIQELIKGYRELLKKISYEDLKKPPYRNI